MRLKDELNPGQLNAVRALIRGNVRVIAGAGSGKTRTITFAMAYLVHKKGVDPRDILLLTFTRQASNEMIERANDLTSSRRGLKGGTFHSFAANVLREKGRAIGIPRHFLILDPGDAKSVINSLRKDITEKGSLHVPGVGGVNLGASKNQLPSAGQLQGLFSTAANKVMDLADVVVEELPHFLKAVSAIKALQHLYTEYKQERGQVDFDDLLTRTVDLLKGHADIRALYQGYRYILVDEYQDTNTPQAEILRLLVGDDTRVMVVGDDSQCLDGGTLIQMGDGSLKPIRDVQVGEAVLAHRGDGVRSYPVARRSESQKTDHVRIKLSNGRTLDGSADHVVFACMSEGKDYHYVYLMYRPEYGFRLGITQGARGRMKHALATRATHEGATKMWFLRACKTKGKAAYLEAMFSLEYQIPTLPFSLTGRDLLISESSSEKVFRAFGRNGFKLLQEHKLSFDYPAFVPKGKAGRVNVNVSLSGAKGSEVSIESQYINPAPIRASLQEKGWPVSDGRRNTGRIRRWFYDAGEAETQARELEGQLPDLTGVESSVVVKLSAARGPLGEKFVATTLSAVVPGMWVWNGSEPVQVKARKHYYEHKTVYDLTIEGAANFIAEGVCVHNCLYGWRGANYDNIFTVDSFLPQCETVKLEQNYRSTSAILDLVNHIQDQMDRKFRKRLFTDTKQGGSKPLLVACPSDHDEARFIVDRVRAHMDKGKPLHEFAVIYRANRDPTQVEILLRKHRIPFVKYGGQTFAEAAHVKDVLAHLRCAVSGSDEIAAMRILTLCDRVGRAHGQRVWEAEKGRLADRISAYMVREASPVPSVASLGELLRGLPRKGDPAKLVSRVVRYYLDLKKVQADMTDARERDLELLKEIAHGYSSASSLLQDMTLDPTGKKKRADKDQLILSTVHSCVHPSTFVEDDYGLREIKSIPASGQIATVDGSEAYTEKFSYEDCDLLTLKTEGGYELTITTDHRMMSWRGDAYVPVQATDLTTGSWLRMPLRTPSKHKIVALPSLPQGDVRAVAYKTPAYCDRGVAELLGMIVADGTVYQRGFRFTKRYKSSVDLFCRLVHEAFGYTTRPTRSADRDMWYAEVGSARLAAWLLQIGGMAPHAKDVPVVICRSPREIRASFLRGLFEDGTVNDQRGVIDHVSLTTKFERIAILSQIMLTQLGIINRRFWVESSQNWRIDVSGVHAEVYRDRVGFACPEKQGRLETGAYRKHPRMHSVPLSWREADALSNQSSRQNGKHRGHLSRWIIERDAPSLHDRLDYHHVRIATITKSKGPSMCVEVPKGGRFLQNGFDGCNSKGLEWPTVVIMGAHDGGIPRINQNMTTDLDEERRVLYVALSRAQDRLIVTYTTEDRRGAQRYIARRQRELTRFLREAEDLMTVREYRP